MDEQYPSYIGPQPGSLHLQRTYLTRALLAAQLMQRRGGLDEGQATLLAHVLAALQELREEYRRLAVDPSPMVLSAPETAGPKDQP